MIKYVLFTDLNYILHRKKIFFLWIFIILLYPIFLKLSVNYNFLDVNSIEIFYGNIGSLGKINSLIECSMLLLNISFFCYITIYIFTLNNELGKEIVYLRIPYKKWLISKIISIVLITFFIIFSEICLLILLYMYLGMNISINELFSIIVYNFISRLILVFLNLLFFQLNKKIFFILTILIYIVCGFFYKNIIIYQLSSMLFSSYYNCYGIIYMLLLIIVFYILSVKTMYCMFRRD